MVREKKGHTKHEYELINWPLHEIVLQNKTIHYTIVNYTQENGRDDTDLPAYSWVNALTNPTEVQWYNNNFCQEQNGLSVQTIEVI